MLLNIGMTRNGNMNLQENQRDPHGIMLGALSRASTHPRMLFNHLKKFTGSNRWLCTHRSLFACLNVQVSCATGVCTEMELRLMMKETATTSSESFNLCRFDSLSKDHSILLVTSSRRVKA